MTLILSIIVDSETKLLEKPPFITNVIFISPTCPAALHTKRTGHGDHTSCPPTCPAALHTKRTGHGDHTSCPPTCPAALHTKRTGHGDHTN